MERTRPITLAAAAATVMVAVARWAATTSSRVGALEERDTAHEERISKAESDADLYRKDIAEVRDRISCIEGYLKRLTQ